MSKREAFLEAVCKENVEDFLRFIQLHKDKTDPFDVEEVVQEMSRNQRETLWGKLSTLLQDVLQELPPERWDERREANVEEEGMEVDSPPDPKRVMSVVDGVTLASLASLKVLQDGDTYTALLDVAFRLQDVLVSLPISDAQNPLQLHIHTLCEAWWKKGLKEKDKFGCTAFVISLQKSFILKKPGAEIQRVWSLHNVLLTLDYTSEENKEISDLLLQCFHRPVYIRHDDGKRFLVFLFSWHVNFVWVIHGTIKNQLEFYSKASTTHITEIYFRAWKKAGGDFQEQIESSCIQDFMQCAIFLHRSSPVHSKVRQIVRYFHSRKSCPRVEKMLDTLYKPILWKALSVPNSEVRANATLLFTDAFPIHDPEQGNEIVDKNVQKQLDTAMKLLDDPYPVVRSNATLGVCKILAKCWELLPATIVKDFLKKLITELSSDASSPDVRCSVFKCLPIVLDNALSHPILEKLLPRLKYSLHDNSEKVRAAFLDMLIKVKAVRAAKFWDVCNMDHLLARLAVDSPSVSKRIVELLFKSFFPTSESDREWCCRCITLVQMNPAAARKFYQGAYKHTAPTNIIKLMLAIRRALNGCIEVDCDASEMNDGNKENSAAEPLTLGQDMAVVSGLLEVVVILWRSMEKTLKKNEEAQKYTVAKFGNVISRYFQAFEDERCTVPLIQMASFMPPAAVPTFSCGVVSKLKRLEASAAQTQYSQLLDCLCSWGQAANVLELVSEWLSEPLPKQAEKDASSRRVVRIQETVEAKPDLALLYLEYLFNHTSTREKVLALGPKTLHQLHTVLGNWKSVLYAHLSSTAEEPKAASAETALRAFTMHGRLGAHLQHNASEGREYLLSLEHVAAWVAERVIPSLDKCRKDDDEEQEDSVSETSPPLPVQIIETFLTVCRDVLLVGLGDDTFKAQVLHLCSLVLLSEAGYLSIPAVLPVLTEVASGLVPDYEKRESEEEENPEDRTTVILGVVANIFQKIIELLARRLKKQPEKGKQLCVAASPGLKDFLQVAQTYDGAPLSGVFSTIFAVMVVEKRYLLHKMTHPEEVIVPESVDDMPPLSSVLLSIITKSPAVGRSFLREVKSSLDSEAIGSLLELAAALHILAVVKHSGSSKAVLKSSAVCLQRQLHTHAFASSGSSDVQGVIYDSSVKILNQILDS